MFSGDRLKKRVRRPDSLATAWWEFFHFTLLETLIDDDRSIYGAIFEYDHYNLYQNTPNLKLPPHYVIAFRGTVLKGETWMPDVKLDIRCILDNLHQGPRTIHAIQAIRAMIDKHSESAIWLAGHSLGAALVLLAGKTMKISGFLLESYIFNPPIISIPLEQLPGGVLLKGVFRITESLVKATATTVTMALTDQRVQEDSKTALWIPYLYVNPADPICAGYIDYFKHKTFMSKIGASIIEKTGSRSSFRHPWTRRIGTSSSQLSDLSMEPLHLLPSADMTVNKNKSTSSMAAHGLHQWWEQDSVLRKNWKNCLIRPDPEDKS
ncbi:Fungal lipase-like domain [Arabidopsis thaliana x Arabidopsis arenosa]|nr:Fungal lipase-like domain [Arabidopsis thaliana x Arabidopsis arenosa]